MFATKRLLLDRNGPRHSSCYAYGDFLFAPERIFTLPGIIGFCSSQVSVLLIACAKAWFSSGERPQRTLQPLRFCFVLTVVMQYQFILEEMNMEEIVVLM